MRQKIKSIILRFISLKLFFLIIDWKRKVFKPGGNQVNVNIFFTILSRESKPVSFVQIGANDGIKNDPIFTFVRKHQWKGILVEPLPNMFERLVANYNEDKSLSFENVGVSDQNGEMIFYFLPPEYNNPDWLQQIGTFDEDAIKFNLESFPNLIEKIESRVIKTVTLKELFSRNRLSKIDLLIIDAEGFEYRILAQLEQLIEKPSYILFEWGCMKEDIQNTLFSLLYNQKYKLYSSSGDILAVHRA